MADHMQGLLAGMESPLFGMGAGLMSGRDFGSGMQQGFNNMQVQRGLQQRQDYATSQMVQRVAEQRQKRQAQEQQLRQQQAITNMYPNVLPGMTVPGKQINARSMGLEPGSAGWNEALQPTPLVEINNAAEQSGNQDPVVLSPDQIRAAGLEEGTVAQVTPKGDLKIISKGTGEGDAYSTHNRVQNAFNKYREALQESGTEMWPGEKKLKITAAYNDLKLEAKELYKLGVIAGPDEGLIEGVITNPTAWLSQGYSGGELLQQLDSVFGNKLSEQKAELDQRYGKAPTPPKAPQPPPGFTVPMQ
jgi:hypothetical protein